MDTQSRLKFIITVLFFFLVFSNCPINISSGQTGKYVPGAIPFPLNYSDYITRGNNLRRLFVFGDTIVVITEVISSASISPSPEYSRTYYQVSTDGGNTWLSDAVNFSPATPSSYPNGVPCYIGGQKGLIMTGRLNTNPIRGFTCVDAIFGIGSTSNFLLPVNSRDFVAEFISGTVMGGTYFSGNKISDTLRFSKFNYGTNVYSQNISLMSSLDSSSVNYTAVSSNGANISAMVWKSNPRSLVLMESTNSGTSFGSPQTIFSTSVIENPNDTCSAWNTADIIYKPNTTRKCVAFSTVPAQTNPTKNQLRKESKIMFWSPQINGGNPVKICDLNNYLFLSDSTIFGTNFIRLQTGMSLLSHPSLAYSDDGRILYCAFSAVTKDTNNTNGYPHFNYNVIQYYYSPNDGLTWKQGGWIYSNKKDYLFPSLLKSGISPHNYISLIYTRTNEPGSSQYKDGAVPDTCYTYYYRGFVSIDTVIIKNISSEIPNRYTIYQNYPNPFNPSTNIKFQIQKTGFVTIRVFDITGREIRQIVNETLKSGTYECKFDASGLSSGVYFYRMTVNNFTETKSMVILK